MKYITVILNLPIEAKYTYLLPSSLENSDKVAFGCRVRVPFRSGERIGFVIDVSDSAPEGASYEIREVKRVIDKEPVFTRELLRLAEWMSYMYFSSTGTNLSLMVPSAKRESEAQTFINPASFKPISELTAEQSNALSLLRSNKSGVSYLLGATGTGKSEVFLRRAEDVIKEGRQVLYLVPEITLSHQVADDVYSRFSGRVAILHSSLTPSQRLKAWKEIMRGEISLVVGARSSVFAPFKDLGLIIIDEEHETSYKSGSAPRYHARQVAQHRAETFKAGIIMGSATPSLEAWRLIRENRIKTAVMRSRIGEGAFPSISEVSLLGDKRNISEELEEEMRSTLESGRSVILFLNRRGYSYAYSCGHCGHIIQCPNCSVSLTYHKRDGRLVCHTCGYSTLAIKECPECGSRDLFPRGFGTERVEEEVRALFPQYRIARLDTDAIDQNRRVVEEIIDDFKAGNIDILLGTQMIAKGLNFPNAALVGVINADSTLMLPDFRSAERTFTLLHQVSGRVGRYRPDGRVIIQTTQPNSLALRAVKNNDAERFYESELRERHNTLFPPYSRLIDLTIRGRNEAKVKEAIEALEAFSYIEEERGEAEDVEIFGASPNVIYMKSGSYRYHLLLRSTDMSQLLSFTHRLLASFRLPSNLYLEVDVDPVNLF